MLLHVSVGIALWRVKALEYIDYPNCFMEYETLHIHVYLKIIHFQHFRKMYSPPLQSLSNSVALFSVTGPTQAVWRHSISHHSDGRSEQCEKQGLLWMLLLMHLAARGLVCHTQSFSWLVHHVSVVSFSRAIHQSLTTGKSPVSSHYRYVSGNTGTFKEKRIWKVHFKESCTTYHFEENK